MSAAERRERVLHRRIDELEAKNADLLADVSALRAVLAAQPQPLFEGRVIPDDHPEAVCEDCDRRNISWSIDSDRWNLAAPYRGSVLCPSCFVLRHERVTGLTASWTLVPATPFRWAVAGSATPTDLDPTGSGEDGPRTVAGSATPTEENEVSA